MLPVADHEISGDNRWTMEDDITASPQASQNRKAKGRRQKDSQRNPVCRDNRMQVDWDVTKVRLQINCAPQTAELAATWNMEEYPLRCSQISPQIRQDAAAKNCRFVISSGQKRGSVIGYNGFNRISGTKIHVAVEQNGLPVSVVMSCKSAWLCKICRRDGWHLTISGWEIYQKNCAVPSRQGLWCRIHQEIPHQKKNLWLHTLQKKQ